MGGDDRWRARSARTCAGRRRSGFAPRGTLFVNLTGAFVAGLVTGADASSTVLLIAGTGFLGGYTTFSTWMVERTYLVTSIVAGLAVATLGYALGSLLA